MTANVLLEQLNLNFNPINNIDLSSNTQLQYLHLNKHLITSELTNIDLSNNPLLVQIDLHGNPLVDIDLTQQTQLIDLNLMGTIFNGELNDNS